MAYLIIIMEYFIIIILKFKIFTKFIKKICII